MSADGTTPRSRAFVEARLPRAAELGKSLADEIQDPDRLAERLRAALASLADPVYRAGQQFVAPGIGSTFGVRTPLLAAMRRAFRSATRRDSPATLLLVADRLLREPELEPRWFAFGILDATLGRETERTWQLLRRAGPRGGRLDHGRHAGPPVRAAASSPSHTAGPSSSSWCTRRRAGSGAWSVRPSPRSRSRTAARGGGRRSCDAWPGAAGSAHRRHRA